MEHRVELAGMTNPEDLWTQLQQKDADLELAAELGKALLDKNEELKKQQDAIVEEYSRKLEAVEQDRHILKRKLAAKESECDSRVLELQNDLSEITVKLSSRESQLKQWERDKGSLVTELNAQNARLTAQLKEAAILEQQLQQQAQILKEQCQVGKSSLQEHVASVDSLRDELNIVSDKNIGLERRLHMAAAERDSLASALEEASGRILGLERHAREQEIRWQHSIREYDLPQERLSIEERLASSENRSLLAEMDISEPTLSQECMAVYRQLRQLCQQLKAHHDDDSGLHSDCSVSSLTADANNANESFTAGLLSEAAQELVNLVLDTDVVRLLERLDQSRREIQDRDLELQRRAETIMELQTKLSICEVELGATLEERDRARHDASYSSLAQDEVVSKARDVRDQAVARKNKAEIELAKNRVELMQANSQLLEAIQQKVELSQQLEQWQMDMQELLDEQLRTKLTSQETTKVTSERTSTPARRKLFSLFR